MLTLEAFHALLGAFLLFAAARDLGARRRATAAFWAILAAAFLGGGAIQAGVAHGVRWPAQAMGVGVLALGALASRARSRGGDSTAAPVAARMSGLRLFGPALAIPLVTLVLALAAPWLRWHGAPLLDTRQPALVALGLACVAAFVAALRATHATPAAGLREGHRLLDALGWAVLLPMLLATLGSVFAATGVGDSIARLVAVLIPVESRLACLAAFALGMVLFTVVMGNAFAAFPVIMAGIGLPLLVLRHGAHPAVLGSIGMLTGYCGTLLTPMAANFNIVPAVLLELPDPYGVIRAQWPTALALLAVNLLLMAALVFR
ncbi:MAG TPA: DUF979 family protein [Dokdonella sp.]